MSLQEENKHFNGFVQRLKEAPRAAGRSPQLHSQPPAALVSLQTPRLPRLCPLRGLGTGGLQRSTRRFRGALCSPLRSQKLIPTFICCQVQGESIPQQQEPTSMGGGQGRGSSVPHPRPRGAGL